MLAQQFQLPLNLNDTPCTVQVVFHPHIQFIQWQLADTNGKESFTINRMLTEDLANQITTHVLSSLGVQHGT